MDPKSPAANFAILQTFLAGAGLLAPKTQSVSFFDKFKYYVIAIIFISTIGIGFLLTGLYLYLSTILQPFQVCIIMGAVLLGLAFIILLSRMYVIFMIKRKIKNAIKDLYEDAKDALEHVADELKKPIADNPKIAMTVAVIAGFVLIQKLLSNKS